MLYSAQCYAPLKITGISKKGIILSRMKGLRCKLRVRCFMLIPFEVSRERARVGVGTDIVQLRQAY
jgi:hypothetical protein